MSVLPQLLLKHDDGDAATQTAVLGVLQKHPITVGLTVIAGIQESSETVRLSIMQLLQQIDPGPQELVSFMSELQIRLEDQVASIRSIAVDLLSELPDPELAAVMPQLQAKLEDSDVAVQRSAIKAMGRLDADGLQMVMASTQESSETVRLGIMELLQQIDPGPQELVPFMSELQIRLEDQVASIRSIAVDLLSALPDPELAAVMPQLQAKLEDSDVAVQRSAIRAMGRLDAEGLLNLLPQLLVRLEDADGETFKLVWDELEKLPKIQLVCVAPKLVATIPAYDEFDDASSYDDALYMICEAIQWACSEMKQQDVDRNVCDAIAKTLEQMPLEMLKQHAVADALESALECEDAQVQQAARCSKDRLKPMQQALYDVGDNDMLATGTPTPTFMPFLLNNEGTIERPKKNGADTEGDNFGADAEEEPRLLLGSNFDGVSNR